jgi:D-3-phosphoglycerate dehydrogenase
VVKDMNLKALNCAAIAGVMKATGEPDVNMVSAPVIARERGIELSTTTQDKTGVFDGYIKLIGEDRGQDAVHRGHGVLRRQAALHPDQGHQHRRRDREHMLYTTNNDVPGIIGTLGQTMGEERRQHRQLPRIFHLRILSTSQWSRAASNVMERCV